MSFTDAAEKVLRGQADGKPMHYRELTERALRARLIATAGKTPEATMYAQTYQENQRRTRRGLAPRFVRLGKGLIALMEWTAGGLASAIEKYSPGARHEAARADAAPVALVNGKQLVDLMVEYRMGVDPQAHEVLALAVLPEAPLVNALEEPVSSAAASPGML